MDILSIAKILSTCVYIYTYKVGLRLMQATLRVGIE